MENKGFFCCLDRPKVSILVVTRRVYLFLNVIITSGRQVSIPSCRWEKNQRALQEPDHFPRISPGKLVARKGQHQNTQFAYCAQHCSETCFFQFLPKWDFSIYLGWFAGARLSLLQKPGFPMEEDLSWISKPCDAPGIPHKCGMWLL